jgi:formylglycine-generating enzyme required for sulfatase activity/energy-coupling factor transporter ATP-binding protein EcfA2
MKTCPQCKTELPDQARFCLNCGAAQDTALPGATARVDGSGGAAQHGGVAAGQNGVAVGQDVKGHVIVAGGDVTIVEGELPVETPAVADQESALAHYLRHIISRNRYLRLQGIRSGGKLVHIELEQIYITLRATRQRTTQSGNWAEAEQAWLETEAHIAPGEARLRRMEVEMGPRTHTETVTVSVDEALVAHPRLVILGDPGSGKTTLLRYLALLYARDLAEGTTLVRDRLGREEGQSDRLPILLPLRRLGAYLKARRPVDDGTEGHALLLAHLLQMLEGERVTLPGDFFDPFLEQGRAVVLLDGLDEVADPDLRRRVSRLVESFTVAYPECRYVVSSRIVGYTGPARLGEEYATTTVRDFTLADVERFLRNWHLGVAVGQMGPGASAAAYAEDQTQQLLAAIERNERIRDLAINPLMLTVIALVHRDRVKLPDRRAELYDEAVNVLLGKWEEAKGITEPPILEDHAFDAGDRRLMLQAVALWVQERQQKEIETADLRRLLGEMFQSILGDWRKAEHAVDRFLHVIQERTGLLAEHGAGVYRYSHLTFQEYLAALAVAGRDDYLPYTLERVGDPWWREVILLEAGHLSNQSRERTTRLVRAIADRRDEPEPYYNLVLAAEALSDVGAGRVEGDLMGEVQRRLRKELESPPPLLSRLLKRYGPKGWIERRGIAMEALARAGAGYWTSPHGEPEWVEIPAGEFWMGESTEAHRVDLPTFHISRVPVTNAQYRFFVEATDHEPPGHWEEKRPPRGKASHPIVDVTWYDAIAYCEWLSGVTGKRIALPSEAEWEKVARGNKDKRAYPWGDTFDAIRCNSGDLGLGDTTPVGVFPDGASPYGVLDMAGNVMEWTRSRAYFYDLEDEHEEGGRVFRGGAFFDDQGYVRCAFRGGGYPYYRLNYVGFRLVLVSLLPLGSEPSEL